MKPRSRGVAVVAGGAGAIGSNLVRALLARGMSVRVIDDLSAGSIDELPNDPRLTFVEARVQDPGATLRVINRDVGPVFHLAALFANQNSVDHPLEDLDTGGRGTLLLLEAAVAAQAGPFVYVSSSCVYAPREGAISEADPLAPSTPYGITKVLGEMYTDYFRQCARLPAVTLRVFNSYGPGEYPGPYRNVVPRFLELALAGKPLPITGTGRETRDFTYVDDVVQGMLAASVTPGAVGQVINLGAGRETRIDALAKSINSLCGNRAGVTHVKRRPWDTARFRLADIGRARKLLGYNPATTLDDGLRSTLEWFKRREIPSKV